MAMAARGSREAGMALQTGEGVAQRYVLAVPSEAEETFLRKQPGAPCRTLRRTFGYQPLSYRILDKTWPQLR